MAQFQLTISPNYIPNWGIKEALRELFQNGIDCQNDDPSCEFHADYDPLRRRLILTNLNTVLHRKTLLLGETSKDGVNTIGKYGEGYKLALLVLVRAGMRIQIENGKELWTPRFMKSRVYESELLVIDIAKHPDCGGLQYIIDGIIPDDYAAFKADCLMFHNLETLKGTPGRVILNPEFQGKVFCNGLYVCKIEKLKYGYDIHPKYMTLNRDRTYVSEFNLTWETSRIWSEQKDSKLIYELTKAEANDVQYIQSHMNSGSDTYKEVSEMHYKDFLNTYGKKAVIVETDEQAKIIKAKYGELVPVVKPTIIKEFITTSSTYSILVPSLLDKENISPTQWIEEWIEKHGLAKNDEYIEELLSESENWKRRN
jgi:hypothetical protein